MVKRTLIAFVYLFPVVLFAPVVQADATLTMKAIGGTGDSIIEVKGNMMRMSTPGEADYLLYDAKRGVAIHVNSANREYMEIDRATVAGMSASMVRVQEEMAPQMAQMRERLKNLPPEQRAMIEQQLGGRVSLGAMGAKPAGKVTTVKRGGDKIAGFECERYDVMNDGRRVADVCVATRAGAGMSKADFSTVSSAMKFMRDMAAGAQKLSAGMGGPQISMGDVDGVPVSAKDFHDGREYRLVKVSDAALSNARFTAYRSLSKREMPQLR